MDRVTELLAMAGLPDGRREPLSGGDVGEVVRVGDVVVKTGRGEATGMFRAEARGLRALAAVVRTPEVVCASPMGLVLEYLAPGPAQPEALGRAIAELHATPVPTYGHSEEVFLGRWAMPAGEGDDDWCVRRVQPLLSACAATLGASLTSRIQEVLTEVVPPREGPRLLHGDLWSGNVVHSAIGPAFIDPAHFGGERAADLAMMDMFGGFGPRCMAAYEERLPIPPEVRAHRDYYALLYHLVHVWMFGGAYVSATDAAVGRLGQS